MCLSLLQIQDLGKSRSKSAFSQMDTYLAFSFLFPSVLLSCYNHLKAKLGMYFCPSIFEHFRMVCLDVHKQKLIWDHKMIHMQNWPLCPIEALYFYLVEPSQSFCFEDTKTRHLRTLIQSFVQRLNWVGR